MFLRSVPHDDRFVLLDHWSAHAYRVLRTEWVGSSSERHNVSRWMNEMTGSARTSAMRNRTQNTFHNAIDGDQCVGIPRIVDNIHSAGVTTSSTFNKSLILC